MKIYIVDRGMRAIARVEVEEKNQSYKVVVPVQKEIVFGDTWYFFVGKRYRKNDADVHTSIDAAINHLLEYSKDVVARHRLGLESAMEMLAEVEREILSRGGEK